MALFEPVPTRPSHEDLFLARYAWLLRQAGRLAGWDRRSEPEDLVQEAFVRFVLARPDLDRLENLDGYLATLLRNLHVSRLRRTRHVRETSLSILDYDSAETGLRAVDVGLWLQARDELRAACRFACARRTSTRAASLFLLRFFYGYVPDEIGALARVSLKAVDQALLVARRDVKAFLRDPAAAFPIAVARSTSTGTPPSAAAAEDTAGSGAPVSESATAGRARASRLRLASVAQVDSRALLTEFRMLIFEHRHAECFADGTLRATYAATQDEPVSTSFLAELVTCPACLERANRLLDLDSLGDRFPPDSLGTNARRGPLQRRPRPTTSGPSAACRRRLLEARAHQPRELSVAVNGHVMTVQSVSGRATDLELRVSLAEPIGWVEVISDQGTCLAFLTCAPPPAGEARQAVRVELSAGRFVMLAVDFSEPWPVVHATYVEAGWTDVHEETGESGHAAVATETLMSAAAIEADGIEARAAVTTVAHPHSGRADRLSPGRAVSAVRRARRVWWRQIAALRGLRPTGWPRSLVLRVAIVAVAFWLFVATPFTSVSAAQWVVRVTAQAIDRVWTALGREPRPTPLLPSRPATALPYAPPAVAWSAVPLSAGALPVRVVRTMVDLEERTRLELQALSRLQQAGAYLGQEVSLTRGATGVATVRAIVADDARKRVVGGHVGEIGGLPWVRVDVRTLAENSPRSSMARAAAPRETRVFAVAGDRFPAFDTVRDHLLRQSRPDASPGSPRDGQPAMRGSLGRSGPNRPADVDAAVRQLANRVLDLSRVVSRHAWAVQHLAASFPTSRVDGLTGDARLLFASMLQAHAREVVHATAGLQRDLRPIFRPVHTTTGHGGAAVPVAAAVPAPAPAPTPAPTPERDAHVALPDLWRDAARLARLASEQEHAVRGAFSIATDGAFASDLTSPAFVASLDEILAIAQRTAEPSSLPDRAPQVPEDRD